MPDRHKDKGSKDRNHKERNGNGKHHEKERRAEREDPDREDPEEVHKYKFSWAALFLSIFAVIAGYYAYANWATLLPIFQALASVQSGEPSLATLELLQSINMDTLPLLIILACALTGAFGFFLPAAIYKWIVGAS